MSSDAATARSLRARIAATRRHRPHADISDLQTELRTTTAEAYIRRLVDQAPPLSEAQRARLAAILRPTRQASGERPVA